MSINIKREFELLRGTDNLLELDAKAIKKVSIENGQKLLSNVIEMTETHIEHFGKKRILKQIKHIDEVAIVNIDTYPLYISYNIPTDQIILNLSPFNVTTITAIKPDPRNIYAALVYGTCFRDIVKSKGKYLKDRYAAVFASYLTSMMIQMFGREYGLLVKYSRQIPMLKYIISCYVLISFFNMPNDKAYMAARAISGYADEDLEKNLVSFDLNNIGAMLDALSKLGVLPGINKPLFMGKLLKYVGVQFIPALEDVSRMISLSTASIIKGSNIIPTFIRRYNEDEFLNILELGKAGMR